MGGPPPLCVAPPLPATRAHEQSQTQNTKHNIASHIPKPKRTKIQKNSKNQKKNFAETHTIIKHPTPPLIIHHHHQIAIAHRDIITTRPTTTKHPQTQQIPTRLDWERGEDLSKIGERGEGERERREIWWQTQDYHRKCQPSSSLPPNHEWWWRERE